MLNDLVDYLILPPGGLILLGLLGLLIWGRIGRVLVALAILAAWALSAPVSAIHLIDRLQYYPVLSESEFETPSAQAIVVLGGGRKLNTPDYGDTLLEWGILRLRYAALLHRETGLPVVPVGGAVDGEGTPEGILMRRVLEREYGISTALAESDSRSTYENAVNTWRLLSKQGITRIYLVTHAMHMKRAAEAFQQAGFEVVPAPTDYVGPSSGLYAWTPHARTLYHSYLALHELLGRWWYTLRYY